MDERLTHRSRVHFHDGCLYKAERRISAGEKRRLYRWHAQLPRQRHGWTVFDYTNQELRAGEMPFESCLRFIEEGCEDGTLPQLDGVEGDAGTQAGA